MRKNFKPLVASLLMLLTLSFAVAVPVAHANEFGRNLTHVRGVTRYYNGQTVPNASQTMLNQAVGTTRNYTATPGWQGTLTRQGNAWQHNNTTARGRFQGNVSCQGVCIMP